MNNQTFLTSRYLKYSQKISPLFRERRVQAYTMIILSLLTISFFGSLAIRPTLGTIITLQKQIQDRTLVNQKLEEKINALITAQASYQAIEADLPLIYTLLPDNPDITSLLLKVEALTTDSAATISALSFERAVIFGQDPLAAIDTGAAPPQTPQTPENVLAAETPEETITTPLGFAVTFEGTYEELKTILNKLQALDRIVTIKSAALNIAASQEEASVLKLDMQTAAHYYPLSL